MRRMIGLLSGLLVVGFVSQAWALGTEFGVRLGFGPGFGADNKLVEDADISSFVVGPGVKLDLLVVALEVDLLYSQTTLGFDGGAEGSSSDIGVPVIGKLSFPLIPVLLDLNVGLGLEPRFHLSSEIEGKEVDDDKTNAVVWYLPLVLGADVNVGLATVGAELRYLYQLNNTSSEGDGKVHHLLFMAGAWF